MDSFLFIFVIGMGVLSVFLVNDTIALLRVPIIIHISKQFAAEFNPKVLFIALAFSVSIRQCHDPQ
jgi:Na+/H+ antiporter NhaD/arsenite permease-like protein